MEELLFLDWWDSLSGVEQIFWSTALVASLLLCIVVVINLFESELITDSDKEETLRKKYFFDARWVFVFFAVAGWTGVIALGAGLDLQATLIWAAITGAFGASAFKYLLHFFSKMPSQTQIAVKDFMLSTGQVLTSIPPHRNGFGKVHLDVRESPFEFDAITAGHEIPQGAPVRIVDIIDDRVVLVEPIDKEYPGQR